MGWRQTYYGQRPRFESQTIPHTWLALSRTAVTMSLLVVIVCSMAKGDSINVSGKSYRDVYIGQNSVFWYVLIPATGEMLTLSKKDMSISDVVISEDRVLRAQLHQAWKAKQPTPKEPDVLETRTPEPMQAWPIRKKWEPETQKSISLATPRPQSAPSISIPDSPASATRTTRNYSALLPLIVQFLVMGAFFLVPIAIINKLENSPGSSSSSGLMGCIGVILVLIIFPFSPLLSIILALLFIFFALLSPRRQN